MMPTFVKINQETCIGCGACEDAAPDIFGLNEDGLAFVKPDGNQGTTPISDDKIDVVEEAAEECPTDSVTISDHPFET